MRMLKGYSDRNHMAKNPLLFMRDGLFGRTGDNGGCGAGIDSLHGNGILSWPKTLMTDKYQCGLE